MFDTLIHCILGICASPVELCVELRAAPTMALRALAGGRLFAHVGGALPPTVLALHGWGRSGADFDGLFGESGVVALDLPGFGASPAPDSPIGAHGYAERIRDVLSEFDEPPVVVAHSFGGRVAVALEADHPGSFAGMVLTGVPLLRGEGPGPRTPFAYRLVRAANRWGLISDDRLEREKRKRGSADYRAATGVMRDVLVTVVNESYAEELRRLDLPVRMVWGADDRDAPVSVARRSLDMLGPRATLDVVDGAGHFVLHSHPERIVAALDDLR